ncbi:MAG: YhcH/YjgK/YiaL family protein [Melioribacteraceae bacterium]|nr:YhcH/YjgK/YiaL family protein [Melioribacteraceae bacterium]MCF8263487.1 YhcH/YjgK/YiaL family protein [Melioribacteraceae bacterium]MCF8296959.1 YhcH/YjgK/YiaL family protein [Saprospiraceae bacterium]
MVYDHITNSYLYYGINEDIKIALKFIENVSPDIGLGEIELNNQVKAIISEYETVSEFSRGFEAHKNVIDIQYPILGRERIKWSHIEGMEVNIPYDELKDRTFYMRPKFSTHIDIGNGFFAIMYCKASDGNGIFINYLRERKGEFHEAEKAL